MIKKRRKKKHAFPVLSSTAVPVNCHKGKDETIENVIYSKSADAVTMTQTDHVYEVPSTSSKKTSYAVMVTQTAADVTDHVYEVPSVPSTSSKKISLSGLQLPFAWKESKSQYEILETFND